MKLTIEALIKKGILYRDEPNAKLEDHGYVSYVVDEEWIVQFEAKCGNKDWCAINYVQLIHNDEGDNCVSWCVQLDNRHEQPNHHKENELIDVRVFSIVDSEDEIRV